ncbi:hypothetical protein ABBQ32_006349 [Trebouxia sp. C0010 RCD-2024]
MMTYSVAAEATQYSTAGLMWKASLPSLCPMISPASVQGTPELSLPDIEVNGIDDITDVLALWWAQVHKVVRAEVCHCHQKLHRGICCSCNSVLLKVCQQ